MKKILTIALLAAMLCSASACEKDEPDFKETITVTSTTAAVTEEPVAKPAVITLDEVNGIIASAKEEYAVSAEITLSDGTLISAETKDPGITAEDVSSGAATKEQMNAYTVYMANIRRIVCDRLLAHFPEENCVLFAEKTDIDADFLFLDPVSDGFDNPGDAIAKMASEDNEDDVVTDYIMIQNSAAFLFDADTNESVLLCPSNDENAILTAIAEALT